nr:movement protein [Citrus leprosis virus C]
MALSTNNNSSHVGADDFLELENILSSEYNEEGIFKTSKTVCIRTDKRIGVGFLTPNDMISRLVGFINRKAEDAGVRSVESFRQISDVVLIIVPQIALPAELSLKLVDSANILEAVNDQEVTVNSTGGPCVVVMNCAHSIPNEDRTHVNGSEVHRRLGIQYQVDCDNISGRVTTFSITALWREAFSFRPSFYKVSDPLVVPISVGFRKAVIAKSHADLQRSIGRGLIVTHHSSESSVTSESPIDLTVKKSTGLKIRDKSEDDNQRKHPAPLTSSNNKLKTLRVSTTPIVNGRSTSTSE